MLREHDLQIGGAICDVKLNVSAFRFCECAEHCLIAGYEKLSWLVRCFVVIVPRLLNLDADDWRRGLPRRLHSEDDGRNDRDRISFHPFPSKPPLKIQAMAGKASQTNTR